MRSRWIWSSSVIVAVIMLALPVLAFAQTSRVEGMALQGDYIKDYTGIYTYTSLVSNVGNLVYGELGNDFGIAGLTPLDRSVGAVLGNIWDGRYGTWAVHLRQFTPQLGQGDVVSQPNPGFIGFDPNTNSNQSIDLMWGKKIGTTSYGLRFNRSYFKSEDELPGVTTKLEYDVPTAGTGAGAGNLARNIIGVGGGLGFEMNPNTNVELSFLYENRSFENSVSSPGSVTKSEEDNPNTYQVAGRAFWQWQPNVMVVPVFKYYSFDLSNKETAANTTHTFDNTLTGWQAGAAGNWTLGTNDLFVLGVTFAQNRVEQQAPIFGLPGPLATTIGHAVGDSLKITETLAPVVFAALETHVNSWLTLRFGANKGAYQKIDVDDRGSAAEHIKATFSDFNMNIGAGVKLGTLQLDAVVNDAFPQTLGGLFSNTANFVSFPKVTATYAF